MLNYRVLLIFVFVSSLSTCIKGQTTGAATASGIAQTTVEPLRKQAIEQRFFSTRPVPLPWADDAVPGSKVIEARRRRAAAQLDRVRAAGEVHPMGGGGTTNLPGIQFRANQPAGGAPTAVVTGDFNRDGHMDFIVANGNDSDLWIYFGNGDGTFQLPQIIPLTQGLSPVYLATADLRGTGKLDLVVAEYDSLTVGVLLGNGDGTFGLEQEYTLPQSPSALAIADFNRDGKLDIAVAMQTTVVGTTPALAPLVGVLYGDGTGHFSTPSSFFSVGYETLAVDLSAGDVNGDGFPDLLLTGSGFEGSEILLNSNGAFSSNGTFGGGGISIVSNGPENSLTGGKLGDVNEDGCLDAVMSDYNTNVWVALGDCSGHFTQPQLHNQALSGGDSNVAVRLADVNGDGHLDILTTSAPLEELIGYESFGNSLNVLLGDGKGNFSPAHSYSGPGEAFALATAAFKDGGPQSIVTANQDTDTATVYLNNGAGNFGFPQGVAMGFGMAVGDLLPTIVDLNGDGKPDAFMLGYNIPGEVIANSFLNDGSGALQPPIQSDTGLTVSSGGLGDFRLGNFRGTGKLDVVVGSSGSTNFGNPVSQIAFLPGNGDGTFGKATVTSTPGGSGLMSTGDFNGDGKLDFVTVGGASSTFTLTPFLGNGDGTFHTGSTQSFTDGNSEVVGVYTGDFNRDGKQDVLVTTMTGNYTTTTNTVVWEFLGNGDGTFQAGKKLFTGFGPMTMTDLNADGHPDIVRYDLSQGAGSAKFTNYLGQADGSFLQASSYAPYSGIPLVPLSLSGDSPFPSIAADLNGDRKLDEVAFQEVSSSGPPFYGQILMGNGDGTFIPTYNIIPFYAYGYPYFAHDMDGDGITDMIGVDLGSSSIYVTKGAAAPALQLTLNNAIVQNNSSCGVVFADVASNSARTVTFFSSIAGVFLPASVTMPANSVSVSFCYTLSPSFNSKQVFDVNATMDGSTATAYASAVTAVGFSETVSPTTVSGIYAGQSTVPVTVTLTSIAGYSSTATLSCSGLPTGDSCQFAQNPVTIPANGSVSTTMVLNTVRGAQLVVVGDTAVTIGASDGAVTQRKTLEVPIANLIVQAPSTVLLGFTPGQISSSFTVYGLPPYTFSCSGLPAGATCSFSGTQNSFPASSAITLIVTMSSALAKGSYPFTFQVASNGLNISDNSTLYALGLNVQDPPASGDWTIAGYTRSLPLTLSTSATVSGYSFPITCTLDVTGTCGGANGSINATAYTYNLPVNIPTGVVAGQHNATLTATLNGTTQTVTVPFYVSNFSGSLNTSAVTMKASTTATVMATLTATTGFSGQVQLNCSYVAQVTCSFSPSSPQLTAGTAVPVTITITTSALASVAPAPEPWGNRPLVILAALLPVAWILRRRRPLKTLLSFFGLFLLASLASCSSGGSGGSGGGSGGSPTTNTYTLTVNAVSVDVNATQTLGAVTVTVPH